ncbi:uncharacterized protein LOC122379571 [Amphibalanus amphitrite]|uniref:uncharacterized protein LOC122379571 n=1 Tax=Amphibalanus amphitrite TaxID=1232801 RepID=UPI001C9208D5|nr:uncharacterized protein LOC122379571 [Amphibalanus amphitrite]
MGDSDADSVADASREPAASVALAALKNVMTPESRRVLRNLELTEVQRADPEVVLDALERFAVGQVNEVIERKRADEAAARDAVELRAGGLARAAAHRVDAAERHRAPPSAGPRRRDGGWCAACGRRRHRMGDACPARGQRCRSCRQLDHFAAVCPDASGDYDDRRPTTSYERRRLAPSRPRSSPPGRSYRPDPYRSSSRSPSPSLDTRRSQRRQPWRGNRVRFQSSEGSSDRSPDGAARRPAASAIIAVASVQSAPRVRLDVTAQRRASVLALPDTGADICVGGLDFLKEMDEYLENLLPPEQHPRTANGETVKSLGVLPVSLNLGRVSVQESVHILEGVSGLLLSWKAVKGLHIIPAGYPQQITADLPEPASGSRSRDAPDRPRPGPARHRHRSRAALPDGGTSSDCVAAVSHDGAAGEATAATPVERHDSSLPTGAPASEDGSAEPPVDQGGSFPDITSEFPTVFDGHIRVMPGEQFKIHLREEAVPFRVSSPRRVPLSLRTPLKDELQKLVSEGIIVPVTEPTEWCAPIVVEPKKEGGIRLCVDLSRLNKFVRTEQYQAPTPLEEVASIASSEAKWFTVFDAAKGYHQCPLHQDSVLKTTFITPFGRYAFLRAPYGVSSISDHYNRRMDEAFSGLTGYKKIVDDVVVYSRTREDHIRDVRRFMERCEERGISLNRRKLQLAQQKVKFAGFIISADGYEPDPQLTSAISSFPTPKNISELRSFFGLANQVAPFVDELSELLLPLRPLLSTRNEFIWDEQQEQAFILAKKALTSVPNLAYFDPRRPTSLSTDASRLKGFGFLLRQQQEDGSWRVIQAGSRFLSSAESRYATIELEATAVVWAMKKCHIFLSGLTSFTIFVDHKPLVPIINGKTLDEIENPRLQRLKLKMAYYGPFVASWVPGSQHKAADALSRSPTQPAAADDECGEDDDAPALQSVLVAELRACDTDIMLDRVECATSEDPELQMLRDIISTGFPASRAELAEPLRKYWPVHDRLSVEGGIILCGMRILVPLSLRRSTLASLHASHLGKEKTKERARRVVYWPGMDAAIDDVTRGCSRCQQELPSQPRETMLHHEPAARPFQVLDMDFADHAGGDAGTTAEDGSTKRSGRGACFSSGTRRASAGSRPPRSSTAGH